MEIFEKLHQAGNTIIVVTHEPDIAQHAHRIIRLRDGLSMTPIGILVETMLLIRFFETHKFFFETQKAQKFTKKHLIIAFVKTLLCKKTSKKCLRKSSLPIP